MPPWSPAARILVVVWHLLADPYTRFQDLGAGFYASRVNNDRKVRNLLQQLEALGLVATLNPAA